MHELYNIWVHLETNASCCLLQAMIFTLKNGFHEEINLVYHFKKKANLKDIVGPVYKAY